MSELNKPTFIYGLIDPKTQELRYVGKTVKPINYRLSDHISKARRGGKTYRCSWIRSLLSEGFRPEIVPIETIGDCEDWRDAESFWIAYYKSLGSRLTNLTHGGDGTVGYSHSEYTKKAQSEYKLKLYDDEPERRLQIGKFKRTAPTQKNNVSGFRGVSPGRNRWDASIKIGGRSFFVGSFAPDDSGRIEAARACDRLEMFVLGYGEFTPRLACESGDLREWCETHNGLCVDDVVRILRAGAYSTTPLRPNNKSGYRGVTPHKKAEKWQARTFIAGQAYSVGLYPFTPEGALEAAKALDVFECKLLGRDNVALRVADTANDNFHQQRKAA